MHAISRAAAICIVFSIASHPLAAAGGKSPDSVILISIDTLRADHLSSYGYKRIRTPHIDSYAQPGTIYTAIASQVPLTLPSHVSLFTSTYPFENQIEENAERLSGGAVTLASILKTHGYNTGAFIGSVFLEKQLGLDQGFDVYDSPFNFEAFSPISGSMFFGDTAPSTTVREKRDAALVVRAANQWLKSKQGQPVFAFVHLFDLHKPYDPHRGVGAPPGTSGYDAEVLYVDQVLGAFKKTLIDSGWWDHSLVIVLSDHGESLGEHGEASHGVFIYQSTVWVPLLIHWPAGASPRPPKSRRVGGLIDVAPTILDFLRIPAAASLEGKSLLSGSEPAGVYSESLHTHDSFGWAPLRSLRSGRYKYIQAPRPELYDLEADPYELNNLYRKDSAPAAMLSSQLRKLLARYAPKHPATPNDVSPQTRALLGSLGYLAPGPGAGLTSSGPDPKDRLPELQLYETAQLSLYYGRTRDAIAALRRLLKSDPHNTLAQRDLGASYLATGAYPQARQYLEQVLAVAPGDYMAQFELGLASEHLGLYKDALEHLEAACKAAPEAAQCRRELATVKQKMSSPH